MKWLCRYCLFISILILWHGIAVAQHPYYYQLKETEGIIGSEIYSIHQDKKGYVWLAGNEGMFRYDGKEVKQYTCANQNGKSISDIKEDLEGGIWCKNFNGQIFYVSADSLKIAVDISKDYPTYPETAIGDGGVYYSALGGLAHFNIKNGKSGLWHYPGSNSGLAANIFRAGNGAVYVTVMGNGIFRFDRRKYSLISKTNNKDVFKKLINSRGTMFAWGKRLMFFSEINPERKYFLSEIIDDSLVVLKNLGSELTKNRVFNCCPVSDTSLWLCTQEGAICLNKNLLPLHNGLRLFQEADISNVMKDSEDNYWFTSLDKGVYIVPNIAIWRYDEQHNNLPDDNVTAMYVMHNDDALLGYFNGDVSLLRGGHTTKAFQSKANVTMVRQIIANETEDHFLIAQGITTYFDVNKKSSGILYPGGFRDICYTSKNKVLFASIQNAGWFTMKNGKTDSVHLLKKKSSRYVAYTSSDNLMWVGYSDGTYYYDSLNREQELLFNGKKVFATAMKTDTKGHLWVGTVASGLLRIHDARVIMHISGEAELNGNNVRALCCKDSLVWVATEKGLNIINTNTDKVSYLDWHDGLPNAEVRAISVTANTVYLATNKGLITFPAMLRTVNSISPQIAISKLMVNDEYRQVEQVIHLNHDENKLVIFFGTKGFTHKHQYSYSYFMKGLDNSWTESGYSTDYARFTSLPPGKYTFYVKAYNEDGFESANIASVQIQIANPFWSTWWFYALSAITIAGIVSVMFYFRIRHIKQRTALEKGISASQLAALKAQMNPHFVYNALNSIQDLVLQNDIKSANLYFGKFSNLMRKVLDVSGKDKLPLNEEIEMLKLYLELEKLRFGRSFEYNIHIEGNIDADEIEIPPMIIQPFVENALKHGLLHKEGDKCLDVRFDMKPNTSQMVCTITDNGVGRKKAAEINERKTKMHRSFAVNATRKRLELLNKYYHNAIGLEIVDIVDGTIPVGTMVVLSFPVEIP